MSQFTPHEAPAKDLNALPLQHSGRPIGRDDALREIYTVLRANQAVLVRGASGMGKTTLAAALAAAYTQQAGGVLWLSRVGALSELLARIGRAYRAPEVTNSDQTSAMIVGVASLLAKHKPLIVIDEYSDAYAIRQFLEKVAHNLPIILLHSDENAGLDGVNSVSLSKMNDADALSLFKQRANISDDSQDIDGYGIAKLVGYSPLGIVISARGMVAAKANAKDYYKALETVAKTQPDGLSAAIATSYRALNNALQGLLLLLGATPRGELGIDLLALLSNAPADAIDQAMSILSQLYLAERFMRYGKAYYRLHAHVRQFAQASLAGTGRLEGLLQKFRESLISYAQSAVQQGEPLKLAAEMDNLLQLAEDATQKGDREPAAQLLMVLTQAGDFIKEAGYVNELLRLQRASTSSSAAFPAYGSPPPLPFDNASSSAALNLEDADFDEDLDDEDEALDGALDELDEDDADEALGLLDDDDEDEAFDDEDESLDERYLSNYRANLSTSQALGTDDEDEEDESLFRQMPPPPAFDILRTDLLNSIDIDQLRAALAQAKASRDGARQLQILKAIGKVQVKQGKDGEAIPTFTEILNLAETLGDEDSTLDALDMLSALLAKTGNSEAAIMHATRGIQLAKQTNDSVALMNILMTLGDARQDLGETDSAVKTFSEVVTLARQNDDQQHEAIALYKLGYAHLDNGDPETPITLWEQARQLFKQQNKRDYEGRVMGGLGSAYAEMGRWSEAIGYYKSGLYIAREVGDKTEEMIQLSNLARAQVESKQLPDALLSYRQALHLAYEGDDPENIVLAIVDLVNLISRSPKLLGICQLLIQDAENYAPHDREVLALSDKIAQKLVDAGAQGVLQTPVKGTARDYAANAYQLLEN